MNRESEIKRVRDILEEIGLQFANGVAVALVDRGVRTKNGFGINIEILPQKDDINGERFPNREYSIEPKDYK